MPYRLFDTAFGTCAIAWSEAGLTRVHLPERTRAQTEARVRQSSASVDQQAETPDALVHASAPAFADEAVDALQAFLAGDAIELQALKLDERALSVFNASVYRALRALPRGETVTYGALAKAVGKPKAARAVGMAMGRNPWPVIVPCHRVLARGKAMGGFSAHGGATTKAQLLALEGVLIGDPLLPGLVDGDQSA
ncbi:MAG: methylated-DNA--[protein]-cysteine S-methyltransferase [Pseudomonadota bacterium]